MAKKSSKLNTSLDDDNLPAEDDIVVDDIPVDVDTNIAEDVAVEGAEDDITYTMGKVLVAGADDEEEEKLDLKKIKTDDDGDEDEEWIDDEYIQDDYDPYLDDADYDMDNPYDDDDF